MSATAVKVTTNEPSFWSRWGPKILLISGGLAWFVNIIVLGMNVGTQDTNQSIRKYVAISVVPVTVSLALLAGGLFMYFSQYPAHLPYAAIILALFAIGVSNMAVCISLIEKVYG
jgi:hypothetical protein